MMTRPFSEGTMVPALQTLTFEQVIVVLKYVISWISLLSVKKESKLKKRYAGRIPSLAQVFDWIICLLDSHFTSLIYAEDRCVFCYVFNSV